MRLLPFVVFPLLGLVLCSCAGYERSWKRANADHAAGRLPAPEGPWEGTWTTTNNDHTGKLRAIVKPAAGRPGEYDFHYHATWGKVFSGTYKVRYPVTREGGRFLAKGTETMGVFGTFGHSAVITGDRFEATFSSDKGDVGSFLLKRPSAD